jgi:hypothetical protein
MIVSANGTVYFVLRCFFCPPLSASTVHSVFLSFVGSASQFFTLFHEPWPFFFRLDVAVSKMYPPVALPFNRLFKG